MCEDDDERGEGGVEENPVDVFELIVERGVGVGCVGVEMPAETPFRGVIALRGDLGCVGGGGGGLVDHGEDGVDDEVVGREERGETFVVVGLVDVDVLWGRG